MPTTALFDGTSSGGIAAIETAIGLWGRCLKMAKRSIQINFDTEMIARHLILDGEFVALIEVIDGEIWLTPSPHPTIIGGANPLTWRYKLTIPSPSETQQTTDYISASRVCHIRLSPHANRAWEGTSPLTASGISKAILERLSTMLANEARASSGYVLPTPSNFFADQTEASTFFASISTMLGRLLPFRKMSEATMGAATSEYRQVRVGFDPPATALQAEENASQSILRACGIPPGLVQRGEGSASREALKIFLYTTLMPVAETIAEEFRRKINPRFAFDFDPLLAVDVQARARAYNALTGGGLSPNEALGIVGMQNQTEMMP